MKKIISLMFILVFVISCGSQQHVKEGEIKLNINLKKGESYPLKVITEQQITQAIQGEEKTLDQTITFGYKFDVVDVDEFGVASVKFTFDEIQMKSGMGISFDSKDASTLNTPQAKMMSSLIGQSLNMKIKPNGKVEEITGFEEMFDSMFNNTGLPDNEMMTKMKEQIKKQYSSSSLTESMEQAMAIFPDKPVVVGETWTRTLKVNYGMAMSLQNTWTLKERKDGKAIIDVTTTIVSNDAAEPLDLGMMQLKYNLQGEQSGTIIIDEETGWTVSGDIVQNIHGTVETILSDELKEQIAGQDVNLKSPIKIKSKIKYLQGE